MRERERGQRVVEATEAGREGKESRPSEVRDEERGIVGGTKRPSVYEHRKTMNSVTAWPPVPWRAEPRPFPFHFSFPISPSLSYSLSSILATNRNVTLCFAVCWA